jgi:hypothetical protein
VEISRKRSAAVQRVKLFTGTAESLIADADKKKQ